MKKIEVQNTAIVQTIDDKLEVLRKKINEIIDFLQGDMLE